jgi:twinkle protein
MPHVEEEVQAIQFPYFRDGVCVNIKYRSHPKGFRMVGGAERILYGLDDIQGETVTICEGEIDCMSIELAGYPSVISVPDGAPAVGTKDYASKFDFLLSAEGALATMKTIILAGDADGPGQTLMAEMARRLGPERCKYVAWPEGCKDANEVLLRHGVSTLTHCLDVALPWPVSGIVSVDELYDSVLHMKAHGIERGLSPGWYSLAQLYTVRAGEMTIVTGIPSHGKTQFVTAMVLNLARDHGWKICLFSPENYPMKRYVSTLLEYHLGKPFFGTNSLTPEEILSARQWLNTHVSFLLPTDDTPTIDELLRLAQTQVYRYGIEGLVLDPWNEISHDRPAGQTETEYISLALTKIRRFARNSNVHVWVVAHPTKLQKARHGEAYEGKIPPPTPYDVAGSSHFRNKADNCLTVWRDLDEGSRQVDIHVQKIRFRDIGKPGTCSLVFDATCGRYNEPNQEDKPWSV